MKLVHSFLASALALMFAGSYLYPVSADQIDSAFSQSVKIVNDSSQSAEFNKTYSYSLEAVTDPEKLDIIEQGGMPVSAGVEGALSLIESEVSFSFSVDAGVGEYSETKEIPFAIDMDLFTNPGVYRYELSCDTTGDVAVLDAYILREEGSLTLGGCIFYEDGVKVNGFVDEYVVEEGETTLYNAIFRFIDTEGNKIADDIVLTSTVIDDPSIKSDRPVKAASLPGRTLGVANRFNSGLVILYTMSYDQLDSALEEYDIVKKSLLSDGYKLISDDVASHPEGESWFADDPAQTNIYYITFEKSNPSPINPKTGEPIPVFTYYAIGFTTVGAVLFLIIVIKNKKENNSKEEN